MAAAPVPVRGAAGQRKQHALGQKLTDQPALARAERGADGQLALDLQQACQQQIRDVRARDQQYESAAPSNTRKVVRAFLVKS
jgi:putative hemolysin